MTDPYDGPPCIPRVSLFEAMHTDRDPHFSQEDDVGVAIVLGLFVALFAVAFAAGWFARGWV